MRKSIREKLVYLSVIGGLLSIIQVGHATHWTMGFASLRAHLGRPQAKANVKFAEPAPSKAPNLLPVPEKSGIEIAADVAVKAGIETATAGRAAMTHYVAANGVVEYDQDQVAQLSVRVPGNVWRVEKQVGSAVRKGDVLAIIEAIQVGEAKADFLQASVAFELKEKTLERMKQVGDSLSERALREAESQLREARVRLLSTHQKLVNLGLSLKLETVRGLNDEERARRIQFLGLPDELAKSLDPETTTTNLIPLLAPFDGVVIGRAITIGEMVTPDQPHFVIANVRRMWIMLDVRKEDAGHIRLGQPLIFTSDASDVQVTGKIDWISTELDAETRTLPVRAFVENPPLETAGSVGDQRLLKAHTFGTAQIVIRESNDSIAIPTSAVQFEGARQFVFRQQGNLFIPTDVRTGVADGQRTEVLGGVAEGDQIAVAGSHVLKAQLLQQGVK